MNSNENIAWEKEASYLASLPRTAPFRVPEKYFEDLRERTQQAVFLAELPQQNNQGFKVPENYFEELNYQIESRIATQELRELAPTTGFKVPANYFDQLQVNILNQTTQAKRPTTIVKLWQSDVMKYVSAACFFLLVGSGVYLKQQDNINQVANVELASEQALYDIDENVIFEHLQESQAASTTVPTDAEMENYILDNFSSSELSSNL